MIVAKQVTKRYGSVTALESATLDARDGEITALIGSNGSGKTTMLRAIAGLVDPERGEISIQGIDVRTQRRKALANLGFMPDGGGLYPMLTAREHVELFARLHGLGGSRLAAAANAALDSLDLDRIAARRTRGFSAGERMRVALARTIVHQPNNLVLDEPSRGLDLDGLRRLRAVLQRMRRQGTCIVLSSHMLSDVETLADRVFLLARGVVRASGPPASLIAQTGTERLEDAYFTIATENRP